MWSVVEEQVWTCCVILHCKPLPEQLQYTTAVAVTIRVAVTIGVALMRHGATCNILTQVTLDNRFTDTMTGVEALCCLFTVAFHALA